MQRLLRGQFYYGWIIVVVTALVSISSAGVRSAPGVMMLPQQAEMGWSRTTISFAVSIGLVLFGLAAPISGALFDRFGARRIVLAGLALIAASMFLSARMTQVWELNAYWGVLSGIATGVIGGVLGATVAARWFVARRGLVTGIFGAATSAGFLIFYPVITRLVVDFGWRNAILIIGGFMAAIAVPVLLLMRDDPADLGLRPYGAPADTPLQTSRPVSGGMVGGVMARAVRSPEFWLLAGTFFVCGASSTGLVGQHFIAYAVDCGIPQVTAAWTLSLMGAMNFLGTVASGWLTDRYDPRRLLAIYYSFRGISLLALPFITTPGGLAFFAVLFGLDYIATVPPTVALTADTFGRKNVGQVYGWVFCAHQVGAALAASFGGVVRDGFGDYAIAFWAAGALAVMAGMLALRIRRASAAAAVAAAA